MQYPASKACRQSRGHDFPPVSGAIIWARAIERQLNALMRRVEDVLGKEWATHVEGQKLKNDGDSFRMKLNTQELFDDWTRKVRVVILLIIYHKRQVKYLCVSNKFQTVLLS